MLFLTSFRTRPRSVPHHRVPCDLQTRPTQLSACCQDDPVQRVRASPGISNMLWHPECNPLCLDAGIRQAAIRTAWTSPPFQFPDIWHSRVGTSACRCTGGRQCTRLRATRGRTRGPLQRLQPPRLPVH